MSTATLDTDMTRTPHSPTSRQGPALVARRRSPVGAAWGADAGAVRPELRGRHGAVLRPLRHAARPTRRPPRPRLVLRPRRACRRARHRQGAAARRGAEGAGAARHPSCAVGADGVRRRSRQARWLADARAVGRASARTGSPGSRRCSRSTSRRSTTRRSPSRCTLALTLSGDMIRRHFSLVGVVGRRRTPDRRRTAVGPHARLTSCRRCRGSSPSSSASRAPLAELPHWSPDRHDVRTADDLRDVSPASRRSWSTATCASFGWRPLAADVEAPTLAEHPDRFVDLVRCTGRRHAAEQLDADLFEELRDRVPAAGPSRVRPARRRRPRVLCRPSTTTRASRPRRSGCCAGSCSRSAAGRSTAARSAGSTMCSTSRRRSCRCSPAAGRRCGSEHWTDRRRERSAAAHEPPPPVIGGPIVPPPDPVGVPRSARRARRRGRRLPRTEVHRRRRTPSVRELTGCAHRRRPPARARRSGRRRSRQRTDRRQQRPRRCAQPHRTR